ncbi:unnamed protein product [Lymnaea stagnalis]|uniref:Uncharacterized protein n=1 Tax=Lymnaea stagnalis TaxID=6523 RepID=A0AAV2I8S9_LYMST
MPPLATVAEERPRGFNACQTGQNWNDGEDRSRQGNNHFPVMPSQKLSPCPRKNLRPLLDSNVNRLTNHRDIGASPSCSSGCTSRSSSPRCAENRNRSNRCVLASKTDLRKGTMQNSGNGAPNSNCEERGCPNSVEIMSPWSAPSERSQSTLSCASNEETHELKQSRNMSGVQTGSRVNVDRSADVCQRNTRGEECVTGAKFDDAVSAVTWPADNTDISVKTGSNDAMGTSNTQNEACASSSGPVAVTRVSPLAVSGDKVQSRTSINLNNNKRLSLSSKTTLSEAKLSENGDILRKAKRPSKRSGLYTVMGRTDSVAGLLVGEEGFDSSKKIDNCNNDTRFGRRFGYNVAALNNNVSGLFETRLGGRQNVIGPYTHTLEGDWSESLQTGNTNRKSVTNLSSNENRSGKRMGYEATAQRDTMGSLITGNYRETIRSGRRSCQDGGYSSMADSNNLKSILCDPMPCNNNNNNMLLLARDLELQYSPSEICNESSLSREDSADVSNSGNTAYSPEYVSFIYSNHTLVDDLILEGADMDPEIPKNGANKLTREGSDNHLERIIRGMKYLDARVCLCTNNNSRYNDIFEVHCKPLQLCKPQGNGAQLKPFKCRSKSWVRPVSKVICTGTPANGEPNNGGKHQPMECTVLPASGAANEDLVLLCKPRRSKTPEIGYGTYKIIGGLSHRHPPPADLLANLKLPPHLVEYTEFMRRCPNFTIGRYDKSDPAYEMLLPANRTSQALKMQLKPFVYARNPRAGKYPPLYHDPVSTTRDLQWSLPAFVNAR